MVIALVGLIFILLLVFVLIIRGQSKKYAKKTDSGEWDPAHRLACMCLSPFRQGRVAVSLPLEMHLPWLPTQPPAPVSVSALTRGRGQLARWGEGQCGGRPSSLRGQSE